MTPRPVLDPDMPENVFFDRCNDRIDEARSRNRLKAHVSVARLAVACIALLIVLLGLEFQLLAMAWAIVPALGFVGLVIWHQRLHREAEETLRAAGWLQRAARRVFRDTVGLEGAPRSPGQALRDGERPPTPPAPLRSHCLAARSRRIRGLGDTRLADQLDLFGDGQLYERLADWRTDPGGETLAAWMLHPASPKEARARQEAIRELAPRTGFRERLAAGGGYRPWPRRSRSVIGDWIGITPRYGDADAPGAGAPGHCLPTIPEAREGLRRALSSAALSAAIGLSLAWWLTGGSNYPFSFVFALAVTVGMFRKSGVAEHEEALDEVGPELAAIRRLGRAFAGEDVSSPRLRRLQAELAEAVTPLSRVLRLARSMRLRRNLVFTLVAMALYWGTQHVVAINRWRRRWRKDLARWARAAGELDALLAIAQYQAERPGHVFAGFDDEPGLEAVDLGHPLLPEARLQRNSIRLGRGGEADILLVTGSNMSGKSTLLKTIGVNFVLARMGAPVTATSLTLGPLALGASLVVQDSLRDGVSRFLAELFALKAVLGSASGDDRLLFLLDEVLDGTNSDDRRLATGALLGELARRGAVGILTTHDLSLTELDHEFPGQVRNMHFVERIADGLAEFDYQLRDGTLPRGNALNLMRILGLPVPDDGTREFTSLPAAVSGKEN